MNNYLNKSHIQIYNLYIYCLLDHDIMMVGNYLNKYYQINRVESDMISNLNYLYMFCIFYYKQDINYYQSKILLGSLININPNEESFMVYKLSIFNQNM